MGVRVVDEGILGQGNPAEGLAMECWRICSISDLILEVKRAISDRTSELIFEPIFSAIMDCASALLTCFISSNVAFTSLTVLCNDSRPGACELFISQHN